MPKGRLVITVKGRFLAWRVCVCAYVCVEFADGFFSTKAVDVRADESRFENTVRG